jgi:hypothetical protein
MHRSHRARSDIAACTRPPLARNVDAYVEPKVLEIRLELTPQLAVFCPKVDDSSFELKPRKSVHQPAWPTLYAEVPIELLETELTQLEVILLQMTLKHKPGPFFASC